LVPPVNCKSNAKHLVRSIFLRVTINISKVRFIGIQPDSRRSFQKRTDNLLNFILPAPKYLGLHRGRGSMDVNKGGSISISFNPEVAEAGEKR
jgi:hypothetical protein